MFEHLPVITQDSLEVMIETELPHFTEMLRQCTEGTETPDEAIDCLCEEFRRNPNLLKAVRACAYGVADTLRDDGVDGAVAWQAGILAVPGLLAALRLIDRALEAKKLEKLGS